MGTQENSREEGVSQQTSSFKEAGKEGGDRKRNTILRPKSEHQNKKPTRITQRSPQQHLSASND
jgi:hypothetical protein